MFENQIREFNENISLLRVFVEDIEPVLISKREELLKDFFPLFLDGFRNTFPHMADSINNGGEIDEKIDELLIEKYGEKIEVSFCDFQKEDLIKDGNICFPNFKISGSKGGIAKIARKFHKYDNQINLLYRNALISLLSSTEWFFSQILHQYYSKHPKAAGVENKTITLSDLKTFGSIKDAEDFLIDSKIEGILRGSFEDWMLVLKNEMKLGLAYLSDLELKLNEIYQRRNIIIHNGGIVNKIFLSKVDKSLISGVQIGDKLIIDEEYLERAISIFHKSFILIAAEIWKSLEPENVKRADTLIDISYENMIRGNWTVSEGLSYFITKDAKMGPYERTIGQLNYWLSKKRLGQWEDVIKDVQSVDYSDKKNILRLGLLGLKEEVDEFLQLLPLTLKADEITPEKVMEFPIFDEIKNTEKFKEYINSNDVFATYRTKDVEPNDVTESIIKNVTEGLEQLES